MDKLYIGIDLGTTNSAVALFDGEAVRVLPNKRGQECTPSIVRITGDSVTVGERARKFLLSDPQHTYREFKRLMGTGKAIGPDSEGRSWLPEQISAEVLKSLADDVEAHSGRRPRMAVVTVPALFELPQSKATAEAARLAGLDGVELLPEPIASALSAGWSEDAIGESWLVFDLGGGTFDVSLIESRDGLLRVVGHDGDNFLGGRDIDRRLVEWIAQALGSRLGAAIDLQAESRRTLAAQLYAEAEQAKIRLSTQPRTTIELDLEIDGRELVEELELTRAELDALCTPLVNRALEICRRLLREHGLGDGGLGRVVLVGGPAHMPLIKERVRSELAPLAAEHCDPMTLVARGAALYAASIDFGTEPEAVGSATAGTGCKFWLQHPTVCSELEPMVMGRLVEAADEAPVRVRLRRDDDAWEGSCDISDEGVFMAAAALKPARANVFHLSYLNARGEAIPGQPQKISIVHGLTLSDPPLSRSVGVALANGYVKTFIERGSALPARRSFVQTTIDTLVPGTGKRLNIPIVQGERSKARFCRKVGNLVVNADDLDRTLHAGAAIEVTIEIDRGGSLEAQALVVDQKKLIKGVAELLIPSADPAALQNLWQNLKRRLTLLQQEAFRNREEALIRQLGDLQEQLALAGADLMGLERDEDTCQRLHRNFMEMEGDLESLEARGQVQTLIEEFEGRYFDTAFVVAQCGNDMDKRLLAECEARFRSAAELGRVTELERAIEQLEKVNLSAYRKSPEFWVDQFHHSASRIHEASDLKKATRLVEQGRTLLQEGRRDELRGITESLWMLLPHLMKNPEQTHDSGIF